MSWYLPKATFEQIFYLIFFFFAINSFQNQELQGRQCTANVYNECLPESAWIRFETNSRHTSTPCLSVPLSFLQYQLYCLRLDVSNFEFKWERCSPCGLFSNETKCLSYWNIKDARISDILGPFHLHPVPLLQKAFHGSPPALSLPVEFEVLCCLGQISTMSVKSQRANQASSRSTIPPK